MTTQHTNPVPPAGPPTPPEGTWGAPVPANERPRTPWSAKKIIISAAVAVVIVAGGTAAVMAATNGSTATSGTGGPNGGFGGGGFGGRGGAGLGAIGDALHGDFVVSNGNNGYTTERLQTGTVTAISATDVTVKSTDGYTQSYVIGGSTSVDRGSNKITDVVKGNTVTVVATLSGQTATANTVEDSTIDTQSGRVNSGQGGAGGPGAGGPGGN
jgi:asparagine N-glycosylation enzyme membrane subunit Stt3